MKKIYITSFCISINPDEDVDDGVEENEGIGDDDADFSTDEGGVDDLCTEMFNGGDVIDNIVDNDTIDDDDFFESISAENVIDDWVVGDDVAVADSVGKVDGNAAAVDTFDNDLASDNTIDGWIVDNNSGDDDTGVNDGFGNNFDANDTTDDKVVGDNASNDANEDEDVGVNVVAFDTVDDEYFGINAASAVSKDDAGFDVNVASSSFDINDGNVGDDIAADNTVRKDDVVETRAGDGTRADFAAHIITDGDDNACKGDNAAAVDVNTDGDFNGNDGNTADDVYGHKIIIEKTSED